MLTEYLLKIEIQKLTTSGILYIKRGDAELRRHWLMPTMKYRFFYENKTCYKCFFFNIITISTITM